MFQHSALSLHYFLELVNHANDLKKSKKKTTVAKVDEHVLSRQLGS